MLLRFYIVLIFIICHHFLPAQIIDTLSIDSTAIKDFSQDTIPPSDLIFTDSIEIRSEAPKLKIAENALEEEIEFGSLDTMWLDKLNNVVHLYGSAYVNFQNMKLTAGYIAFDFDNDEATAYAYPDASGKDNGDPHFEDGSQFFDAKKLRFNFKSKKGMVYEAIKKEGELFVHGAKTKYISKEADTINHVETIYAENGIITSCNAEHPHFGIRASKIKLVPNKLAVLGFSLLEIANIPTPLMLPFGFYPMFQNQRSGIILPTDYTFDKNLGYGFTGIGVYFPINDYMDIQVLGDIYTRGSWGLKVNSNYKKRYKYNGRIGLSYFNKRAEVQKSLEKSSSHLFSININHNQDPKAHPYQKFGGSIALTLNGYDQTFNTDAATRLNNTTRSNFSYDNKLPGSIFSFNAGLEHSQNTQSGRISVTFPVARLNMKSFYPFKSKSGGGREKWYEKISVNYRADAKNLIEATDSTLFEAETFENAKYGLKHNASSSASFSALKYFTITPSVNYSETYFTKVREFDFDPTIILDSIGINDGNIIYDTIYGTTLIDTVNAIKPYRDFNSSVRMSTNMYGKVLFNKGWLRGIRHKITYNVGFNYRPNTKQFYEVEIDEDGRDFIEDYNSYNIFVNGPYGGGSGSDKQMALNYSINNLIEGKFWSRKDSTSKKVSLIRSLSINGNYNFAADSLHFSTIRISGSASFFRNMISVKYTGLLDPYVESNGRRIDRFVWEEKTLPFRHEKSTLRISSGFTIRQLKELFSPDKKSNSADKRNAKKAVDLGQESSLIDIFGSFRISYDIGMNWEQHDGRDTFYINRNVISTRGSIKLTKNWNIRIGHIGYDFLGKSLTYPDLGFQRNLHCWNMNFSWRPKAGQYTFFIGVSSQTFNFIKYNHGQNPLQTSIPTF